MLGWLKNIFGREAGIVPPGRGDPPPSLPGGGPDEDAGFQDKNKKRLTLWGRFWDYYYWGVSEPGRMRRSFGLWEAEPYLGVSGQGPKDQFGNNTLTEKQIERAIRRLVRLHYNNGTDDVRGMTFYCYGSNGKIDPATSQRAQIIVNRMMSREEFAGKNLEVSMLPMKHAEPFYYLTKPLHEVFHRITNWNDARKTHKAQKQAARRDERSARSYTYE